MNKALFIIIGFITCAINCEMSVETVFKGDIENGPTEAAIKAESKEKERTGAPVGVVHTGNEQTETPIEGEAEEKKQTIAPTKGEAEEKKQTESPTKGEAEEEKQTEAPTKGEVEDKTEFVQSTDAFEPTDAEQQGYENQPDNVEQEPVEVEAAPEKEIETQNIQATNTGPSKITVDDALKILEKSKIKYAKDSFALIKRLIWLRSTYNITELVIDHKIDLKESFSTVADTENSNSPNILRSDSGDGFLHIKHAIMKVSKKSQSGNSTVGYEGKSSKENILAAHNKEDYLKTNLTIGSY